jgi:dipeptidyl-peptidase-3
MQARIGITLWLIRDGVVHLHVDRDTASHAITDAYVTVDRAALADGRATASMGRLLVELQVRRSIGDAEGATDFIRTLTTPPEEWKGDLRDYVLANRTPRKVFVQPNTFVREGAHIHR